MTTVEGYHWTPSTGLKQGLPTEAVVTSSSSLSTFYDVVVIGAGYAGLIAARDLTARGHKVLLLEARDRVGGRTWTSVIDGFNYEMGGTWVHWKQPHIYTELSRYGLKDQLASSLNYSSGVNYFSMDIDGKRRDMSHDEEGQIYASALTKFFNVDGHMGREAIPFPHHPFSNEEAVKKWDKLSLEGRLEQLKGQLTREEEVLISSMCVHMSGGSVQNTGFLDLLRWFAHCDYRPEAMTEYGLMFKLKCGQTGVAKRILDDATETGNLDVSFGNPVKSIQNADSEPVVVTTNGQFKAKKVICTIPLNVLHETTFEPPLSQAKIEASKQGHIDMATKIHYETPGTDLKSWSGMAWPGKGLLYAYGDGTTPRGSTHIVAFGASDVLLHGEDDVEATKEAVQAIRKFDIERIVFHNWKRDPFAKGAWCMFDKGFTTKYLKELQKDHGNVVFASADWADGWKGFIDGAIEQGAAAAHRVSKELRRKA